MYGRFTIDERIDATSVPTECSQSVLEIFREATANDYQEKSPYSDGFETVLDAVESGLGVDETRTGIRLVVYDEVLYRAQTDTVAWG